MPIVVRILSGALAGREFTFDKEFVRMGDAPDADLFIDPSLPDNGGARGRIIELTREGQGLHLRSIGNRELSAQHGEPLDRLVTSGEELRFGAWGPIFSAAFVPEGTIPAARPVVAPPPPAAAASPAPFPTLGLVSPADEKTAPYKASADEAPARKLDDSQSRRKSILGLGDRPVGQRTVSMMIQDALGKARESSEATLVEKGTVFVREIVSDTIQNATRSLKLGLALTVAALVVLAVALVYNVQRTRQTVAEAERAVDEGVTGVKRELGTQLDAMKQERDALAAESQSLGQKLGELEKTAGASQAAVGELRARLRDADERRRELEARLARALSAADADRAALAQKLERMEKERQADRERQQAEIESLRKAQEAAAAPPAAEPVQPASPPGTPSPR